MPSSSQAPATAGATGTAASRTSIATPEARASSLSTEATPPRVASRMHARTPGPRSASTAGHSERVSETIVGVELELAAREHDRGAVLADRAGEQDPVAGRARARSAARGSRRPSPVVVMYIPSAWPRSTTFVSPPTIATPAASAARGDRVDLGAQRRPRRRPSSRIRLSGQRERLRPAHREVVDRAVDRELADRAAREAQRLDHERVGGERELADAPRRRRAPRSRRRARAGPRRGCAWPCRRRRGPS